MNLQTQIVNKVESSGLFSFDLATLFPKGEKVLFDIKDNLYQGLILREKDFREFLKTHDWAQYQDKSVAITCSADAIVPQWAFMLLASHLQPYAVHVAFGTIADLELQILLRSIDALDVAMFTDQKVVVKGCGDIDIPAAAYVALAAKIRPVAQSIMFGEPCSTVPIFKRK